MQDKRLSVLIISSFSELVREFSTQIEESPVFRVTGMNYIPGGILDICKALKPVILILDTVFSDGKLLEADTVEEIQSNSPLTKLILLVENNDKAYLEKLKGIAGITVLDRNDPDIYPYLERVGEQILMK